MGGLCFALMLGLHLTGRARFGSWLLAPTYRTKDIVLLLLWGLTTWSWLLFFLSLGLRRLDHGSARLHYANEAALPFYVLHLPVLYAIGFYVVQWNLSVPAKFLVLSTAALLATLAIYEVCVRRVRLLRFLFGMRPAPRTEPGDGARRRC